MTTHGPPIKEVKEIRSNLPASLLHADSGIPTISRHSATRTGARPPPILGSPVARHAMISSYLDDASPPSGSQMTGVDARTGPAHPRGGPVKAPGALCGRGGLEHPDVRVISPTPGGADAHGVEPNGRRAATLSNVHGCPVVSQPGPARRHRGPQRGSIHDRLPLSHRAAAPESLGRPTGPGRLAPAHPPRAARRDARDPNPAP